MSIAPLASLVIPTRNRAEELRNLLRSAQAQTVPLEIHVMDDGDDHITREMIRSEFPQVHYHRLGMGCGPAFQRNRGIELASCNFVFPVDDDALFVSQNTVKQTLAEFDHPRVGAVGIPYVNVNQDGRVLQRAPEHGEVYVTSAFVGAAHCVRRDVFLGVGGYREHFFYMGEEGDLCLRMLAAGYVTRLGCADVMHHLESPNRNSTLADFCGRRNDVLFAWNNVPTSFLPLHLAMTTINGLYCSFTNARPLPMLRGTLSGYTYCWKYRSERAPVPMRIYRLQRRLKKRGPAILEEFEHLLPRLPSAQP